MRSVVCSLLAVVILASPVNAAKRVDSVAVAYTRHGGPGIDDLSVLSTEYDAVPDAEFADLVELTKLADGVGEPDGPVIVPGQSYGDESLFLTGYVLVNSERLYVARLLVRDGNYIDQWFASGMEPITEAMAHLVAPYYTGERRALPDRVPALDDLPDGFRAVDEATHSAAP